MTQGARAENAGGTCLFSICLCVVRTSHSVAHLAPSRNSNRSEFVVRLRVHTYKLAFERAMWKPLQINNGSSLSIFSFVLQHQQGPSVHASFLINAT